MSDRAVTIDGIRWSVSLLAERVPHGSAWRLVLGFRSPDPAKRSVWATYPTEFSSRSALFAQADRLTDETVTDLLQQRLVS
jgi:hypothetical protein